MHLSTLLPPVGLGCRTFLGGGSFVGDSFFIVAFIFVASLRLVLVLLFSTLCPSSFAIILTGKRESWLLYFNCLPDVL